VVWGELCLRVLFMRRSISPVRPASNIFTRLEGVTSFALHESDAGDR